MNPLHNRIARERRSALFPKTAPQMEIEKDCLDELDEILKQLNVTADESAEGTMLYSHKETTGEPIELECNADLSAKDILEFLEMEITQAIHPAEKSQTFVLGKNLFKRFTEDLEFFITELIVHTDFKINFRFKTRELIVTKE